jgi:protein TonB
MQMQTAERMPDRDGASQRRQAGNVVPFLRPEPGHPDRSIRIDRDSRPAPLTATRVSRTQLGLMVAASLALHAAVFAALQREAPPLASVGVQSISVEIVLGGERVAGVAEKPTDAQETVDAVASQGEAADLVKPETAHAEVKVAENVTPVEPEPTPTPRADSPVAVTPMERAPAREDRPPEQAATPMTVLATPSPALDEAPAEQREPMTTVPDAVVDLPRPRPETPKAIERLRDANTPPRKRPAIAQRQKKDRGEDSRTREGTNSAASAASSGIGRGRSDADTNYRGLVAAQLARNKHFPPDAKRNGQEGRAVVTFVIEPSGNASGITLARATGVTSLDSEAVAVVRRSSPFPPPPSGQRERFRVPLNFDIR